MTTATVAQRARTESARACRTEPPGVRAALPFDAEDPEDFRSWLNYTEQTTGSPGRYRGTDAFVLQSWRWKVKDEIKKARRQMPRDADKRLRPVSDLDSLDEDVHPRAACSDSPWDIAEVAEIAAVAAQRYAISGGGPASHRRSLASLTCLGRLAGIIREVAGEDAVARFVKVATSEPAFRRLALRDQDRDEFLLGLRLLKDTGNQRNDLKAAGLHWPGSEQWAEFLGILKVLWVGEDLVGFGVVVTKHLEEAA